MDELLQALAELDGKLDALLAGDTPLTDEQKAEHDKLLAERDRLARKAQAERDRLARKAEREDLTADAAKAGKKIAKAEKKKAAADRKDERVVTPGDNRLTDAAQPAPREAARETIPAEVRRFGSVKYFRGERNGLSAEHRAYRFGMWGLAQLSIQMPGRYRFQSAIDWLDRNAAAVTSKDASGYQYLIPEEFGADLIDLRERYGVARRLFKNMPMVSDTRTDPRRQGGTTAYWVSEGAAGTESNKTWDRVRLTAKDLMALSRITNQVNADAVINWADDLSQELSYSFSKAEDDAAFNGDGTSTYGGIVGARTALNNVSSAAGLVTGSGSTWASLTLADFEGVVGKLPQYAETPGVSWVAHRTFFYTTMLRLELAAGGNTANEVAQGERRPRPLFLGYPVDFAQILPAATASGQIPCLLGNWPFGASFGDRQQDSIAFSEHATIGGENVFERNEIAIRATSRLDINVHDVGDSTNPGPIVGLKTQ